MKFTRPFTQFLHVGTCAIPLLTLLAPPVLGQNGTTDKNNKKAVKYVYPEVDVGALSLKARAQAQSKALAATSVMHDFSFVDRQPESGIAFRHEIVDDAGRDYKPVHYDHGNGIAVADVDGDGWEDLYFVSQLGDNELWRNLGNGKFEDITKKAGVALSDRVGVTASFGDLDNDGDADLFVTTVRMGNVLFENDGKGKFRDVSKAAGLDYSGHSSGAVLFDYNGDGQLDIFLSNVGDYTHDRTGRGGYYIGYEDGFDGHMMPERTEQSYLYRNTGGLKFVDASNEAQLVDTSWTGDATFTDFNRDGFPDLYVVNMQGDDHYYENVGGKRFVEKGAEIFPKTPWGSMGVKFFDLDNNGHLDLYITDMHSDMVEDVGPDKEKLKSNVDPKSEHLQGGDNNIFGNALYVNQGGGKFVERSDAMGVENYWPWGLSSGDLNADGFEDLFVASSMNYPFRYGANSVFLNDGGKQFHDAEFPLGIEPRRDGKINQPWFNLNCDGNDRPHQHCQGKEGKLTVWGTLGTRSSVIFDLDQDGDLDIVTSEFNSEPQVFISDLAQKGDVHFLHVALVGTSSNRDGLGARVEVQAGGSTYTRYHDGKSGYLSQSRLPLYFGLGKNKTIDEVKVTWPNGKTQVIKDGVKVGMTLTVTEAK